MPKRKPKNFFFRSYPVIYTNPNLYFLYPERILTLNSSKLSIFSKMPTLVTDRLIMRKMLVSDYADMYDYASRPLTTKFLLWSPHESPKFSKKYLNYIQGQYREENFYDFALVDKQSGKMIGTCGFTKFDLENNSAEIGYVLSPDFWGKGLAAEALRRIMAFGFDTLSLHRITAKIMDGNTQSMRVAEKCGMRHEATLVEAMLIKGQYRTIHEYAILAREWKQ